MTKPTQWPCLGCGALLSGRGGKRYCGPACRPRCKIEDCGKPVHTREMCSAHATRDARYGDPLAPKVRQKNEGSCSVEGCDQPMRKVGMCASHYAMKQKHGEIRDWLYRHGEGGYVSTHTWIRRHRGAASEHACVDCGGSADEWSYEGGSPFEQLDPGRGTPFARDLAYYSPRCFRCHRIFDENPIVVRR